jgi:hypothetical protein
MKRTLHYCSRTLISGKALSGREPVNGKFPALSDSFHRQNVQRSAGLSCKRELYALFSPPAYRSSAVLVAVAHRQINPERFQDQTYGVCVGGRILDVRLEASGIQTDFASRGIRNPEGGRPLEDWSTAFGFFSRSPPDYSPG